MMMGRCKLLGVVDETDEWVEVQGIDVANPNKDQFPNLESDK